ncbi:MAG: type I DNA topoisomerase [Thermodesulfobacterium sp.]|jgi:DNA topoisomerase-1|nr:type I DNA topoisomerase [Thermodesulfobacterium sp.]
MTKLFVVESPTKIKTLKKILSGQNNSFILLPTFGHIKDLPKTSLGVDLTTLQPTFVYLRSKYKVLRELKRLAKKVSEVYLATDPDREGEAISYHVREYLLNHRKDLVFYRLDLREITPLGVKSALSNLREVDERLYESFLARRVLDRLIGYLVSPYLSRAFKQPLSAGRVQSPALRLIVEREREIENFKPEVSYGLTLTLKKDGITFTSELHKKKGAFRAKTKEELEEFYKKYVEGQRIYVEKVETKEVKEAPPPPFKTSTLIESAGKAFGFSAKETMFLAQRLYEQGYITYHRTDSTRVSPLAKEMARRFIVENFGPEYSAQRQRRVSGKFAQDAHEAIRPTRLEEKGVGLPSRERMLYQLIWQRFLASEMASAVYLQVKAEIKTPTLPQGFTFVFSGKKLLFPGFKVLFAEEAPSQIPDLSEKEELTLVGYKIERHETKPPSRYTEESLIKKMESLGIGRPSTYATMLDILYQRGYIKKEKRELVPTELGKQVCDFLCQKTPFFMDYKYTAEVEEELDEIAKGGNSYDKVVKEVLEKLRECLRT